MKNNGFTLIELLSVIVIFAITFLIVLPSMNSIIGSSEKREVELIEERVLSAAKEYVNNIDGSFYKNFYKEGDTSYVYKSDLINAGLIDENEISKLNTWGGVKGELLSNDKIRYTVEYINTSDNQYTLEEMHLMIQEMRNNYNNLLTEVNNLKNLSGNGNSDIDLDTIESMQSQINNNTTSISNLTNKDNSNNVFLKNYPVGSIYVSTESANPGTKFGGTWVSFGAGRTLVGVDSSQTEFATIEKTGGEKTHTLTTGEMPSHSHYVWMYLNQKMSITIPAGASYFDYLSGGNEIKYTGSAISNAHNWQVGYTTTSGGSGPHNNLQPYITVYMWKRTA